MKRSAKSIAAAVLSLVIVSSAVIPAATEIVPAARCAITAQASGSFTLENGVLTISGSPTRDEILSFRTMQSITSIVAAPGTRFPEDCSALFSPMNGADHWKNVTSIDLSMADTQRVTTMRNMFYCLTTAETINVAGMSTNQVTDMSYMFAGCFSLTSLELSSFQTGRVTTMSSMFEECWSLTSLETRFLDTSNVTNMQCMFKNCKNLSSLDLSRFNTASATTMSQMFSGCRNLPEIDVRSFNTSNVTNMSYMFQNCEKVRDIPLAGFDTSSVTEMTAMFSGCKSLTYIALEEFNTENVESMNSMFSDCEVLSRLDISSFDTHKVKDMSWMFIGDRSLHSIIVGKKWNTDAVTQSRSMFVNCEMLGGGAGTMFNSSNPVDKTYACIDGFGKTGYLTGYDKECCSFDETTGTLTLRGLVYPVNVNEYSYDSKVKKVVADEGAILPDNCTSLFMGFRAQSIDLSKADSSYVRRVFMMFSGCSSLTGVDLTGFDTSRIEDMGRMFEKCGSLTELDLSSFDTRIVNDMDGMFTDCTKLKTIIVGDNWSTAYLLRPYNAVFTRCSGLVGGAGTVYDSGRTAGIYARIDGGTEAPGYLTKKDISFKTNSMTLGGSISLNFYVSLVGVPEDKLDSTKVDFTVNGKNYTSKLDRNKRNSKGYYGFTCPLDAVSMADEVQAVLTYYGPDGRKATLSTSSTAETYLNKFNENDRVELWNIIQAINDFGYYMQLYLSAHSGKPWTLGVDHAAMKKAYMSKSDMNRLNGTYTEILAKYKKTKKVNSDIKNIQYSLILDSDTYINFKITKSDSYKGSVKVMLDDKEVTPKTLSDGRLQVTVSGIGAKQLATSHTVKVITGSKTATFTASALSYAYDCVSDPKYPDTEPYAMIALYQYYKAAVEYK